MAALLIKLNVACEMVEADALITALHELDLIAQSSRSDRRSIALAVAALRNELGKSRAQQAELFDLHGLPAT